MDDGRREALRGHLAMLAFAFCTSGTFSIGAQAATLLDPASLNFLRFAIAALIIGVFVYAKGSFRRQHVRAPWRYAAIGVLWVFFFVLLFTALQSASPTALGAVFALTPLITVIIAFVLLRQTASRATILALLLAATGAIWVTFRGDLDALARFDMGYGEWLFFVAVFAHAGIAPGMRYINRGEPGEVSVFLVLIAATFMLMVLGTGPLLEENLSALPSIVWIAILYTAVFATAASFFLMQFATMRLPAAKVMAYTYLVPVLIIVWEGLSGHGWVSLTVMPGVAAIVCALLLLLRA